MLKIGYKNPDLRLLRANLFNARDDAKAVAAEAEALIAENPKRSYALVGAGKVYAAIGRHPEAMAAFDRALAVEPEAYVYVNRAQARPTSDSAGRLADLDAALKLEPDNVDAMLVKAEQLQGGEDLKGALALYERAAALKPDNEHLTVTKAILLYKLGRADEANKLVAPVRAAAKAPAELNNLCWRKAIAEVMLESALQDCRAALKLAPGDAAYLDSLGMVLLKMGRLDEALIAYNEAVEKRARATSYMGRAFVCQQRGDEAQARSDTAEAVKLDARILTTFDGYGLTRPGQTQTASQ